MEITDSNPVRYREQLIFVLQPLQFGLQSCESCACGIHTSLCITQIKEKTFFPDEKFRRVVY
ncbi:MAG: hypothetical protein QG652_1440 [Pseudomonadota bacterium]|nr:hypothetical protein [Pseudomonadota bacterium]